MFVAGLIIGLLIAWAWFDLRSNGLRSTSSTSTSTSDLVVTGMGTQASSGASASGSSTGGDTTTSGQQMTNADISVPASQPAGSSVAVSSITSAQPVWVVVYSHSDRSGQVMGAARFAARKSGMVDLVHMTVSGQTYYVGLVADTANHTYATRVNVPVVGSDGKQVMTSFVAQ